MRKLSGRIAMLSLLIFIISFSEIMAQKRSTGLELGAGFGFFIYQGDLTPNRFGSFRTMKPGFIISVAHVLSSSFSLRLNLSASSLKGDETVYDKPEYRKFRAFAFKSPVFELSPQLIWNPFEKNDAEKSLSPYVFGGAGIGVFKVQRDYSRFDTEYFGDGSDIPQRIATDEKHTLPRLRLVIPLGAGVRYNISGNWALNIEISYRLLSSDYLDGFSVAANPERNDHYQSISVGLIYRMGNAKRNKSKLGCPVLKQ